MRLQLEFLKKLSKLDEKIDKVSLIKLVEHYKNQYPIKFILDCFKVSRSTYYRWKSDMSQPTHHDSIVEKIENLSVKYEFIYGYRTTIILLIDEYGIVVNVKKLYRHYEEKWLVISHKTKGGSSFRKTYYVTDNKLDCQFNVDKPLQKLVTDITYLHFGGRKLYLSSIMDLYNHEIIAYTISDTQDTNFVLDTLNQLNLTSGAMLHSNQGSVYTSHTYYLACIEKGIIRSMSREGTPADNACIEWLHFVLKTETFYLHKRRKYNKDSITNIIKSYITFYNETKIQRHLKTFHLSIV